MWNIEIFYNWKIRHNILLNCLKQILHNSVYRSRSVNFLQNLDTRHEEEKWRFQAGLAMSIRPAGGSNPDSLLALATRFVVLISYRLTYVLFNPSSTFLSHYAKSEQDNHPVNIFSICLSKILQELRKFSYSRLIFKGNIRDWHKPHTFNSMADRIKWAKQNQYTWQLRTVFII